MPVEAWARLNLTTQHTVWGFSPSSGQWLRNSMSTCIGLPSMYTMITIHSPYILPIAKLDAASHCWVTSLANYNFRLHYRAGNANIDADALLRVSWPGCMPDSSGTHLKLTATAVWAVQEAALKGPASPTEAYSCDLHVFGCHSRQQAGHLYDPRGLVSSPRSRLCPESSHSLDWEM